MKLTQMVKDLGKLSDTTLYLETSIELFKNGTIKEFYPSSAFLSLINLQVFQQELPRLLFQLQ
jgi:hypothetical protein